MWYLFIGLFFLSWIRSFEAIPPEKDHRDLEKNMSPITANASLPVLIVHGGAGSIPLSRVPAKLEGVKRAAIEGFKSLISSKNVLDAVEVSVNSMEDGEAFNAGKGSVLTLEGTIEMEALITEGKNLKSGSVSLVNNVAHPISLARKVMEQTPHAWISGEGLQDFIRNNNFLTVSPESLITTSAIEALEEFKRKGGLPNKTETGDVGTVGAVAVTVDRHLASATSTGGMTGKMKGRIGDTPVLGCGGYSDDHIGAVSTTGHGESIMRYNLAHRILSKMEKGMNSQEATKEALESMTKRLGQTAGAITISKDGDIGIYFTSKRMAWAYIVGDELHYGIEPGEHKSEKIYFD